MAIAKKNCDFLFKLLLIGDSETGKTHLLFRFIDEASDAKFISTIGIDFKIKVIELGGKKIKLQIWDTAQQGRFHSITTSYYRGAHGIMFVYDITNQRSFDSISKWLRNVEEHANKDVQKVLVGNNCEMEDQRQVPREKGEQLAAMHGFPFIETSTVANTNVEKAFLQLVQAILEKKRLDDSADGDIALVEVPEKEETKAAVRLEQKDEKSNCF